MALVKQLFDIKFTQGAETGRDPKTVIPSKFQRLENLEWDRLDTVRQRPGYTKQTITALSPAPTVTNIRRLHALGEEVLLEADTGLHAFLQNRTVARNGVTGVSSSERTFERAQVDYKDIAESQQDMREVDAAVADPSRLECWVWVEPKVNSTDQSVYYRVIDSVTRGIVQSGAVHGGFGGGDIARRPRVVVRNNAGISTFYIYYMLTSGGVTRLKMKSLTIASGAKVPGALSAASDATGVNVHADAIFDAWYDSPNDVVALAWKRTTTFPQVQTNLGSDGITLVFAAAIPAVALNSVSVCVINGTYALMVGHSGGALYTYAMRLSSGAAVGTTVVTAAITPVRVAIMQSPFTAGDALIFYDYNPYAGGSTFPNDIGFVRCDANGTNPSGESVFAKGVALAARPVAYYGTVGGAVDIAVAGALLSDLQPTVFVFKFGGSNFQSGFTATNQYTSPRVLARLFPGECGHLKSQMTAALRMPTCLAVA